ncbi:unnamed protein product, partial [Phaeothamnion confervicola]
NFDKDGNGEIDEQELGIVMRSLGYSPTQQQLKDMMKTVDINGDGVIGFEEFVVSVCEVETDFEKEIREAFKFFDKDGNGEITPTELASIMRGLGANLSDNEIHMLLKEADSNGDGVINLDEFLRIMYS